MDTLKTKLSELEKAANDMAQAMYANQDQGEASTSNADDNVVDADFKEKE